MESCGNPSYEMTSKTRQQQSKIGITLSEQTDHLLKKLAGHGKIISVIKTNGEPYASCQIYAIHTPKRILSLLTCMARFSSDGL